jgi:hypothetical protein
MAPFVDWANVCDANGWKVGGVVYTTSDNSWDILKMIAQAGGGEVFPVAAQLSCSFNAPRVSIGTITSNDIIGDVDVPGTPPRRQRRNTVIARVRLESHGWEEVPLDAIAIPDFIAMDGGSRPIELTFPLVQEVDQGAQLGLYAMWNGREIDGIVLPSKVYALGYRPGDCLTVDIPDAALTARDVVVRSREIEGSTMAVTLTCRTESPADARPQRPRLLCAADLLRRNRRQRGDRDDCYGRRKRDEPRRYLRRRRYRCADRARAQAREPDGLIRPTYCIRRYRWHPPPAAWTSVPGATMTGSSSRYAWWALI